MQKNYRDFTVGELLDMGFNMDVWHHRHKTEEEYKRLTGLFEGTNQSTNTHPETGQKSVKAWKGDFKIVCFYEEETK